MNLCGSDGGSSESIPALLVLILRFFYLKMNVLIKFSMYLVHIVTVYSFSKDLLRRLVVLSLARPEVVNLNRACECSLLSCEGG